MVYLDDSYYVRTIGDCTQDTARWVGVGEWVGKGAHILSSPIDYHYVYLNVIKKDVKFP